MIIVAVDGQIIAQKYRLERHLGSGGFASVWAARIIALDRPVALKILSDNLACNKETVSRFIREAKLSAKAIHPTIVQVEDIGKTEEGIPFLVMELLEGRPLQDVLWERGALSLKECLAMLRPLLEGLAAAHALGIIHRDIKPGNIFLVDDSSTEQRVKILDLGLAKDLDATEALTRSGMLMGTPDYLAPELLAMNQKHAWSPAADIFALGVVAYKMFSGRRPLDGHVEPDSSPMGFIKRASFYREHSEASQWVADLPGTVPAPIASVVYRALAVDTASRFGDAQEMLRALQQACADAGVPIDDENWSELVSEHPPAPDELGGDTIPAQEWLEHDQGSQDRGVSPPRDSGPRTHVIAPPLSVQGHEGDHSGLPDPLAFVPTVVDPRQSTWLPTSRRSRSLGIVIGLSAAVFVLLTIAIVLWLAWCR